jgi:Brp/Blh family beta-carotene 15,15'-monooxygenase
MLLRASLILGGFLLLIFHQNIQSFSPQLQFTIFLTGIVIIGIPHGAADLLVAIQNAGQSKRRFSKLSFFINYIGRLLLFACLIWLIPILGILLFIVFAAYHFGETDLYNYKTDNITGKLFVISYGLLILGIILLHHYEEVEPLLLLIDPELKNQALLLNLQQYRYNILSFICFLFFAITFIYFLNASANPQIHGEFLVQLLFILLILYHLPLMLGFTFYFIVWHSVLSLRNILAYLRKDETLSAIKIAKQISIYSLLAMAGISLLGLGGIMFINNDTIVLYIIFGLAVLTAPHMQIMHDMYSTMRTKGKDSLDI